MLHSIQNEALICTIESVGAEIRSLKNKVTGEEYIWQINESVWGSSSPVLFPAIGKIKEDKIVYNGANFFMPKHGIIRNNEDLIFEKRGDSSCVFTLKSSGKTLLQYPFKFSFSVEFSLIENRLIMKYIVENQDILPMYFACGGHTAYALPLNPTTQLSDYVVEFPKDVELFASTLGESGLLSNRKRNIATNGKLLSLSETLFNEDALIFENVNYDWVRLRKKGEEKGVIVKFTGYPHLALWAKPGADYICVEPWLGLPDSENESIDITQKPTYKSIEPNTTFSIAIETEVE